MTLVNDPGDEAVGRAVRALRQRPREAGTAAGLTSQVLDDVSAQLVLRADEVRRLTSAARTLLPFVGEWRRDLPAVLDEQDERVRLPSRPARPPAGQTVLADNVGPVTLAQVEEAHALIESRRHVGKVVLEP